MIITRAELEAHLQLKNDPFMEKILRFYLNLLNRNGVDSVEVEDNLQTRISA